MTSQRSKGRSKPFRRGVVVCVSGNAVTVQNHSAGGVAADGGSCVREKRALRSNAGHSGQSPSLLNRTELAARIKCDWTRLLWL